MIGRLRQRRLLAEAFEQARDERVTHLFTVLGSAGVGKSRLVTEFLGTLDDATVLQGRCLSYGEGITFWPITEAVRAAAGLDEDDDPDTVRRKIGTLIDDERDRAQVAEVLGTLIGRLSGSATSDEVFWAVRTLLESLARRRPTILVLDDIHWAEPKLLDLVEHLADWTNDSSLLLVCLARQDLLEIRPDWGGGKSYATTITLEPLGDDESRELTVSLLGQVELAEELVDKIATAAEGNPLFVEEMIGMLIDNGYLVREGGAWKAAANLADVAVPPTIHALLAARLDRLPRAERAVIERGAVEGKVFHRSAVADLAPDELRADVPAHLRALARKELVRPDRSDFAGDEAFRFRHLLIRDAAYTAMPKEARADLHARFAAWLERVAADHVAEYEEILAYHLEQAYRYRSELGSVDQHARDLALAAAGHFGASGRRALDRGDAVTAIKLMRPAVELTPQGSPHRHELVADLALAVEISGDLQTADALLKEDLELARAEGDEVGAAHVELGLLSLTTSYGSVSSHDIIRRTERLVPIFEKARDTRGLESATLQLARHQFFSGHAGVCTKILREFAARQGDPQQQSLWHQSMLMASAYWGPAPVPEALAEIEGMDTHQRRGAEALRIRTLGALYGLIGEFETARRLIFDAVELEKPLGRKVMADAALGHFLGPLLTAAGDLEEAERVLTGAYERMTGRGDLAFSSTVAANIAQVHLQMNSLDQAARYADIAVSTSTEDDVDSQARGRVIKARVLATRGNVVAAIALGRQAIAIVDETDYLWLRGIVHAHFAEILVAEGQIDEGTTEMRRALDSFTQKGATFFADQTRRRLEEIES